VSVSEHSPAESPQPTADAGAASRNALSALRLAGVPVFVWLVLDLHADLAAFGLLMASGISDYLDGKIARRYSLQSRLGELLDPLADRLYILATLCAFVVRGIIPLALLAILVGRDLLLTLTLPVLRRHGYGPLPVNFLGKAATFNLLYAFPFLLVATGGGTLRDVTEPIGWAFAVWGTALYVYAGVLYVAQVHQVTSSPPARAA
jgi:cardiolipin synthase